MVFHPLHSETEHSHQIQLIPQGNIWNPSTGSWKLPQPEQGSAPLQGQDTLENEGTPSETELPETLHKIPCGGTNWGEFSLSWMCYGNKKQGFGEPTKTETCPGSPQFIPAVFGVHVLCQLRKLLCLPSQSKELLSRGLPTSSCAVQGSPHIQLCCTGLWWEHSWLQALLVLLHGVTALTPSR